MTPRSLVILGSTGSIGTQALDVVRAFPGEFTIEALSAGSNAALLAEQAREFRPRCVHLAEPGGEGELREKLGDLDINIEIGPDRLACVGGEDQKALFLIATVGWTGVEPTLRAVERGHDVALANKEVLVCAGDLVMKLARETGVTIWPLDSEHNALMQCLDAARGYESAPVRRLILTCSGGAFRDATAEEIAQAGPHSTLAHPTWNMGRKITVDSATLMNKGFEVIEAWHLFDIELEKIEVIVHPQSIIHGIVEFVDGSMIAQMGRTDMRLPIQNVLTQPRRLPTELAPLNLAEAGRFDFREPDHERFPALGLAYEAIRTGGTAACALNAANEVAVEAHLDGRIPCGAVPRILRAVLDCHETVPAQSLATLREADRLAREQAHNVLKQFESASASF